MKSPLNRLFRPSTVIRGFWIGVVVLHLYLFIRRAVFGDWFGGMDQARLVLALAAAIYGTVKTWGAATILDDSPRKALSLAMIVLVGHFAILPSSPIHPAQTGTGGAPWTGLLLIIPAALAMTLLALGAVRLLGGRGSRAALPSGTAIARISHALPSHWLTPCLLERPPPLRT